MYMQLDRLSGFLVLSFCRQNTFTTVMSMLLISIKWVNSIYSVIHSFPYDLTLTLCSTSTDNYRQVQIFTYLVKYLNIYFNLHAFWYRYPYLVTLYSNYLVQLFNMFKLRKAL